jgi:agmatine deiminase
MSTRVTPKALGYRFPAEWEPQAAIWFAWPTREDLWPGALSKVRAQLAALYVLAARFESVRVLCPLNQQSVLRQLMNTVGDSQAVELLDYQTDDVWCRDFGPLFLLSAHGDELLLTDWKFNAWGNKFPQQAKDNAASAWIAQQLALRRFSFDTVLEGGALESNGAGQILSTEAVLLNPNRNGPTSREHIAADILDGLGADEILWLNKGLLGDDTDGHIDNLARFFKPDGILIAQAGSDADPNAAVLAENLSRARAFRTTDGQPFELVLLPLPEPIYLKGEPLAASYMNYLVLNDAVLVPTYAQVERDSQALEIIAGCFPGRAILGFDCCEIVQEGGAIHCMSQHQPAVLSS